ncbi:MAG: sulfatase-like hydrolase/transferase [Chloroflexota bacterium]|nr:sulfatase-like hydrolase/transferase [Chloroflexota bacterium]
MSGTTARGLERGPKVAGSRPNILVIMADEHAPQFSGFGGHPLVRTPHLDRLAASGVLFQNTYCNSPLCVPSRMSFMTGRYVHRNQGGWDNASALSGDAATWAHRLRTVGYDAVLCGKQHFIGPDQLHGFRAQLARDLHAEHDIGFPDWRRGAPVAQTPWLGVAQAGPGTTTSTETDDAVEAAALAYLRDPARAERPWALDVGFIAPHFPLVAPQRYWDLYAEADIDLPDPASVSPAALERQHPVYRRMRAAFGLPEHDPAAVRRGRIGYYALITYLDEKIGRLLDALEETGQRQNTLVVYTSDHGEMAGEHGMWRKSNFYEHSARVPLILSWPAALAAGRAVAGVTSLVDVVRTMVEAAGAPDLESLDGDSLLPLARLASPASGPRDDAATDKPDVPDLGWKDEAFCEYLAHGVTAPMAMLRRGRYKLNYSLDDPVELYDLEADPGELRDLSDDPEYRDVREELRAALLARWNPVDVERRARQSQQERLLIRAASAAETGPRPHTTHAEPR